MTFRSSRTPLSPGPRLSRRLAAQMTGVNPPGDFSAGVLVGKLVEAVAPLECSDPEASRDEPGASRHVLKYTYR
jgi:hypothetical protein